ncbi:copper resistance protein CopC [Planococcus shenhongbingii]|uniref:copper resistance CopC family protein n=1 Tax=Planococcus shenhongbingii TaxID=3058398 RepID=UPI002617A319|nr:copper resistance CopC family protein [Planococcus sp. N016]WKA57973.1 copper resistance protein CopC [Planococcus sp. N016]
MKKITIISIMILLMLPLSVQAHTTLISSNPAEGEVLQMQPEELELVFGTVIEEGSTMTLKGPDQSYPIEDIAISENTMTGAISEELPNGQYIIGWEIIGEDGHPIEGEVPFNLTAEAAAAEPPAENEATEEEPVIEEQTESPEATEPSESGQEEGSPLSTILLVAAAILVGFGVYKLLKKKA